MSLLWVKGGGTDHVIFASVFTQVRRETGMEEVVQVHHDEGVANRIGPEPCAGTREGVGEASAGERAGQPLSRDRKLIPGADAVCVAEGNMPKSANASAWRPGVVGEPGMHARSMYGNREVSRSTEGSSGLTVRGGKARSRSRRCTIWRSQTLS